MVVVGFSKDIGLQILVLSDFRIANPEERVEFKTTHNGKSNIRFLWNFNPKNYPKSMASSVNGSTCTEKKKIEITQKPH